MRAVLDANVLFPTILREILADLAQRGLFAPVWSDRILGEWHRAAARLGPDQDAVAGAEIALMRLAFPQAVVAGDTGAADGLDLPDPADRHVIETALAAGAPLIITANLRDFPHHALAALRLRALHPDAFLCDLHGAAASDVTDAVEAARAKANRLGGDMSRGDMLKRLRLPRLARRLKS